MADNGPQLTSADATAIASMGQSAWSAAHDAALAGGAQGYTSSQLFGGGGGGGVNPLQNPQLAADTALKAQQQASYTWANLLGFYDPQAPQNLSPNQMTLQAMNDLGFLTLPGQPANMPTVAEQQAAGMFYNPTNNTWTPTQAALAQQSAQSGLITSGSGEGGPTAAQQNALGYFAVPGVGNVPTLAANQTFLGAIQNLLANNNSATPFTYLAQQRGVSNLLSPVASFLRGGIFGGTGQTASQLASQPNMTVSQSAQNAQNASGGDLNNFVGSMLGYLYNSVPSHALGQAQSGAINANPGGGPITDGGSAAPGPFQSVITPSGAYVGEAATAPVSWNAGKKIYTDPNGYMFIEQSTPTGATWAPTGQKSPFPINSFNSATAPGSAAMQTAPNQSLAGSGSMAPASGGVLANLPATNSVPGLRLPTGFTTSAQALNNISPTAQSAYQNLLQTAGGENANDFAAGVLAAKPEFAKSGPGTISNMGNL